MNYCILRKYLSRLSMLLLISFSGTTLALEEAIQQKIGQAEYKESCAACHGNSGTGDGPVAEVLTTAPSDLTQISKLNKGFPTRKIYKIIDGGEELGPHGSKEMPIWGDRYRVEATSSLLLLGDNSRPGLTPELISHSRILSLVYYLESIQK